MSSQVKKKAKKTSQSSRGSGSHERSPSTTNSNSSNAGSSKVACKPSANGTPAMLVQFPHATVCTVAANKRLHFSAKRTYDESSHVCSATSIDAAGDEITYTSRPTSTHASYALGLHKKGQKFVKVVPAQLFDLFPQPKGQAVSSEDLVLDTSLARITARNSLVESFGGKKQKKVLNARKRNALSDDALEGAAKTIESSLEGFDASDLQLRRGEQSKGRLLPPHNPAAKSHVDLYPIAELVEESERQPLNKSLKMINKATEVDVEKWRSTNKYPPSIISAVEAIMNIEAEGTGTKAEKNFKSLLRVAAKYSVHLLIFYQQATQQKFFSRKALFKMLKVTPPAIVEKFIRVFLNGTPTDEESTKYTLSKRSKDLLAMYIIVTMLHACQYRIPTDEIAHELSLTKPNLMKLARTLQLASRKVNKIDHLVLPARKKSSASS